MFIEKFDSLGNRIWGSYIGEEGSESTLALAVDREKVHIYQVGTTSSEDIATPGVAQPVFAGYEDCFLAKIQVSPGVAVDALQTATSLTVYPDPNFGEFSVTYRIDQESTLTIYDVRGEAIYSQKLTSASQKVMVNNLSALPGLYACVITAKNGSEMGHQWFVVVK